MEAIDALKQKVLSLAIQGKLVAQDPTDEPASVLLDKIKAEKAELVKQGKIKKAKQESYIFRGDDNKYYEKIGSETKDITEEIPFDIPENWEWVRLYDISSNIPTKGYQVLQSEIMKNGRFPVVSQSQQLIEGYSDIAEKLYIHDNPVLIFGDHTRCLKILDFNFIVGADGTKIIYPHIINSKYLYYALQLFIINMRDRGYSRHFQFIKDKIVPLPPLSEQKRIVEEIEKIFGQIEVVKENQEELNKLKDGLKNKVLDLAIQGKLVEQDPNDEPASVLLEKIKAEKAELVKQGKIKKEKQESYIYKGADNRHYEKIGSEIKDITDEIPFDIPNNWSWCRLGQVCQLNPRNTADDSIDVGFIPMALISDGFQNKHTFNVRKWSEIKQGFTHFANNDVGIAKITPCFENRKSVIFSNLPNGIGAGTTELHVIRPYNDVLPLYVLTICKTEYFITNGIKNFTGTAGQQRISSQFVRDLLIPIPPIQEQYRIVQKISNMFEIIKFL